MPLFEQIPEGQSRPEPTFWERILVFNDAILPTMINRSMDILPELGNEMLGPELTSFLRYLFARFDNFPDEARKSRLTQYPELIRMAVNAIARIITIACVALVLPIVAPFALHVVTASALKQGEFNLLSSVDGFQDRLHTMLEGLDMSSLGMNNESEDTFLRAGYLALGTVQKAEVIFGACHDLFQQEPKSDENSALFYGYQLLKAMKLTATFMFLTLPLDLFERASAFLTFAIGAIGLAVVAIAKTLTSLALSLPLYIADGIQYLKAKYATGEDKAELEEDGPFADDTVEMMSPHGESPIEEFGGRRSLQLRSAALRAGSVWQRGDELQEEDSDELRPVSCART